MKLNKMIHDYYLHKLCTQLDSIGLKQKRVDWIIKEGIWLKDNGYDRQSLCDLIIGYDNGKAYPVELKPYWNRYKKAVNQLMQGKDYIESVLQRETDYGIFVVYNSPKPFKYKKIDIGYGLK